MTTAASLLAAYRAGETMPTATVRGVYERIAAYDDPALFITLRPQDDTVAEAAALEARASRDMPLYGVPVVVKDNIDVAGLPTTAACPAFTYRPERDATAVARLRAAGALIIGKTNLDQFATGLVGMRSPYGAPRNPFRSDLVPGGSSSGSATAVSAGIVPVSLGTDTAGSGRVPAMLNNIVGLKPTLGLVSTAGVVPACRTLDCVSIFALTVEDALLVLDVIAGPDQADAFSRSFPAEQTLPPSGWTLGVVRPGDRVFFGDEVCPDVYKRAIESIAGQGASVVELDYAPFAETARLLYDGPWVAERWTVVEEIARRDPDALHSVTRQVVSRAKEFSAADAFRGLYRLRELQAAVRPVLAGIDAMLVPTAPTVYTRAEVEAEPIRLNSNLGAYTNFVNFLDLCGVSLPAEVVDGTPYGVTLLAAGGRDRWLGDIGQAFEASRNLPLGATGIVLSQKPSAPSPVASCRPGRIEVAVFGAHMRGLPLNADLLALGGVFASEIETAPNYRLYLLPGGPPRRPGVLRVGEGGASVVGELWSLPPDGFGWLVAAIPAPLGFGTVSLTDGRHVKGFLAEAAGVTDARDITEAGGWRGFLAEERETG